MLKIDKKNLIECMNERKIIIDDIYNEYQQSNDKNLKSMLNANKMPLDMIINILNANGYTVEYKNNTYIIY